MCKYTLIELLVVVAIISLLVSILLPSLTKAKELAKNTVCQNHQRQIGLSMSLFAQENKGLVGLATYGGSAMTSVNWLQYLDGRGSIETFARTTSSTRIDTHLGNIADVSVCPSFPPYENESGTDPYIYGVLRGSSLSETDTNAFSPDGTDALSRVVNLHDVSDAALYWLLCDSYSATYQKQLYIMNPEGLYNYGVHLRHNNKTSALFADGHAEHLTAEQLRDSQYTPVTSGYSASCELIEF